MPEWVVHMLPHRMSGKMLKRISVILKKCLVQILRIPERISGRISKRISRYDFREDAWQDITEDVRGNVR